ncbi:MAG: F0F1 ATP synthase subunit A [Patescibacteria group bacterium]|nr:F0F1 ATP synthase subunit A [Patescibacteria group bacterium]
MLTISLQPEYLFTLFGLPITNTFFTALVVDLVLIIPAAVGYLLRRDNLFAKTFRVFIYELLRLVDEVTGDRRLSRMIFPLIATFFLFIVTSNLLEIIPGFLGSFFVVVGGKQVALLRSPNSDLTTTLALAILSVGSTQLFSLRMLGIGGYVSRFINLSSLPGFIMGFFEGISELIKLFSFSFRLFGNIFAGEVLLLIVGFLVPYIIPMPFMILEIFVGIVQAFIFTILSLTFIKAGTLRMEAVGSAHPINSNVSL